MTVLVHPVDVSTAASMLGVSQTRVKKLISDYQLPAVKLGNVWIMQHGHVTARVDMNFPAIRPYSIKNAWNAINAAEVDIWDGVRYQRRGVVTRWCRGADAPTEVVIELEGMLSGNPASIEYLQPIASNPYVNVPNQYSEHDFYLPCSKYQQLIDLTGWKKSTQGMTVVRFVDDNIWNVATSHAERSSQYPELRLAPLAATALDLMLCSGSRNQDAAAALIKHKQAILDAR